jgi:O-antigen ligase
MFRSLAADAARRKLAADAVMPGVQRELKSFNLGIVLVGFYLVLEFGSLQALYPIFNELQVPFVLSGLCLALALARLLTKRVDLGDSTTKIYIVFCIFMMGCTLLTTVNTRAMWNILKLFLLYATYYVLIISSVKSTDELILLIDIWLASMAYSCLHGILQGGLIWSSQWLQDENQFAVMCTTGLPFAFFLFGQKQSMVKKICYLICMALFSFGILVSLSRGGFVAAFTTLALIWASAQKKIKKLMLFALITICAIPLVPTQFFDEAQSVTTDAQKGGPGERFYLWKLAGQMFFDHPLLGVGPANYGVYFSEYDQKAEKRDTLGGLTWDGYRYVAHSTPLTFLCETGIVGSTLVLLLQVSLYKNWRRSSKPLGTGPGEGLAASPDGLISTTSLACAIAQAGYWVGALFLTLTIYPFFWILVPISVVITKLYYTDDQ